MSTAYSQRLLIGDAEGVLSVTVPTGERWVVLAGDILLESPSGTRGYGLIQVAGTGVWYAESSTNSDGFAYLEYRGRITANAGESLVLYTSLPSGCQLSGWRLNAP